MITRRKVKDRTLSRLSIASGVDVSVYSEEPLNEIIQHKFDTLFDDIWWPQFYTPYYPTTIDSNGLPTADFTNLIKRFKDLKYVFTEGSDLPLPGLSGRVNLGNVRQRAVISNPDPAKPFRVVGNVDGLTNINVAFRTKPDPVEDDTETFDMDDHLLILGSAYDYISDLGINPGQEDKLLTLFNSRYKQALDVFGTSEVSLSSPTNPHVQTDWAEWD